jgi:hypothetical protein
MNNIRNFSRFNENSYLSNRSYKIEIKDSALDLRKEKVFYRWLDDGSTYEYKVWFYLTGTQMYLVDHVIYDIFEYYNSKNNLKSIRSAGNLDCSVGVWLGGEVNQISARVFLKNGETLTLNHYLTYKDQLNLIPKSDFIDLGN